MKSLRDQLLKTGLADAQSIKNVRKRKQPKKPKKARGQISEAAVLAEQSLLDKAARDRQLNHQRQLGIEKKAIGAQITQLIEGSKIDRDGGDLAYNFTAGGKIKTLYITQEQQKQLMRSQIAIVSPTPDRFELVPKLVADKIAQRDANYNIASQYAESMPSADDPYVDYQIPDDLMW